MTCKICENEVKPEMNFCPNCGYDPNLDPNSAEFSKKRSLRSFGEGKYKEALHYVDEAIQRGMRDEFTRGARKLLTKMAHLG